MINCDTCQKSVLKKGFARHLLSQSHLKKMEGSTEQKEERVEMSFKEENETDNESFGIEHVDDDDDSDSFLYEFCNDAFQPEKTKDELTIFFLAGNETIKTSSTNTVCYLTQNPKIKAKFMD